MDIHYFTWIRNRIGTDHETLSLPSDVRTPQQLVALLSAREAKYAAVFSHRSAIHLSVNGEMVEDWDTHPLKNDDKVSFFSPLAGG